MFLIKKSSAVSFRISWLWLRKGSAVRRQLEAFRDGAPRDSLSLLSKLSDEMLFTPICERVQEGAHSIVNRVVGERKVTGAYVSLAIRAPEIERCVLFERSQSTMLSIEVSRVQCTKLQLAKSPVD